MRRLVSAVLEVGGAAAVLFGAYSLNLWLGVMLSGAAAFGVAQLLDSDRASA